MGGFTEPLYQLLLTDPRLVHEATQMLLDGHFPRSLHDDIHAAAGIPYRVAESSCSYSSNVSGRDPAFRDQVLREYERRCAVCGFDIRIQDELLGLEAAHIKWHAAGGPDIVPNGLALGFDLLAIDAYRQLIDWQQIRDSGADVLHCFDAMASGESALTSFGMFLASHLHHRTEDSLIDLSDGDRVENIVFRSSMATPTEFPEEFAPLIAAQHEHHIWQPQHLGEDVREIVRGGNPDRSPSMERRDGRRWQFTLAKEFRRDLKQRSHLFEQSIGALMEVCDSPMSARSNTVKPLKNELRGMWRYRMGDFRLIYQPDKDRRVVHFLGLKPRADAYE